LEVLLELLATEVVRAIFGVGWLTLFLAATLGEVFFVAVDPCLAKMKIN